MARGMIRLTPEQRDAVEHHGNLLLSACPGSGKTRVILAKLLTLADQVVDTPRFIGCITYTNAAVDEIEARLRKYGNNAITERCEICQRRRKNRPRGGAKVGHFGRRYEARGRA